MRYREHHSHRVQDLGLRNWVTVSVFVYYRVQSSWNAYIFFLGVSTTLVILHCIPCLLFLLWLGLLVGNFSSYVELAGLLSRRAFAALGAFLQFDDRRAFTLPNLVEENSPFPVWSSWLWLDFSCGGYRATSYAACPFDTRGRQYYAWRRYWGRRRR